MASSGGGKIRNKRNRTAKKPYQRPKSILSQVTETVAGLVVPTWLRGMLGSRNLPEEDSQPSSPEVDPDLPSTSYGAGYPRRGERQIFEEHDDEDDDDDDDETVQAPPHRMVSDSLLRRNTPLPFASYSQPLQTSTPNENEFAPRRPVITTEVRDDETNSSVSTSGCSSLLPHVDRVDHKEKLAKSNLDQPTPVTGRGQSSASNTPSRMSLWSETSTASQERRGSRQGDPKPQPAAKRPRFNASYYGTPRPNTTLTPQERHQSSFYAGRTTFGGSSFYRSPASKKYNPSPYQVHLPVKRHIRPKPAAQKTVDPDFAVTSNTAMKILNTLDRMSTPLSDAKRIPLTPMPSPFSFKPRRVAMSERKRPIGPPVSGLQVAAQARVVSNTQPPLPRTSQVTTEPQTSSSETPRVPEPGSDIRIPESDTAFSQGTPSRIPAVPPPSPPKSGGKMKSKSRNAMHYSSKDLEEEEVVEAPNLPNIALPISAKSMPTFNFGKLQSDHLSSQPRKMPATTHHVNGDHRSPFATPDPKPVPQTSTGLELSSAKSTPVPVRTAGNPLMTSTPFPTSAPVVQFQFTSPPVSQENSEGGFKFSAPDVKGESTGQDHQEKPSSDEFTFSAPRGLRDSEPAPVEGIKGGFSFNESAKKESVADDDASSGGIKIAKSLKTGSCLQALGLGGSTTPAKQENENQVDGNDVPSGGIKVANTLKTGSCLQALGLSTSKPSEAVKPSTGGSSLSLMDKFKPAPGSWECDTCMIRNKAESHKCVACETSKPGSNSSASSGTNKPSLSDQFKLPVGSWTSGGTTSNPLSVSDNKIPLADLFKAPEGSWTCDTCMIRNKSEDVKCVACASSKPGAPTSTTNSLFSGVSIAQSSNPAVTLSFGIKTTQSESMSTTSAKPSLSELFKTEAGSWECDTCMVRNKPTTERCVACETPKPGSEPALKAPPASTFKFGASSTSTESATTPSSGGFKFGSSGTALPTTEAAKSNSALTGGFKGVFQFGIPAQVSSVDSGSNSTVPRTGGTKDNSTISGGFTSFQFGVPASTDGGTVTQSLSKPEAVSSTGGFSLGSLKDNSQSSSSEPGESVFKSTPVSGGFKFTPTTDNSSVKDGASFSFGAASSTQDKVPGVTPQTTEDDSSKPKLGFQFGAPVKSSEPSQSNQVPNVSPFQIVKTTAPDTKPSFTFGASSSSDPSASKSSSLPVIANTTSGSSSGMFGAITTPSTVQQAIVKPGKRKEAEPSSTSTESDGSATGGGFKPTFNFTGAKSVKFGTSKEQTPTLNFGASKTTTTGTPQLNATPFQFGATPEAQAAKPSTQPSMFTFGSNTQQSQVPASQTSGFQFGAVSSSSQNAKPADQPFTFGAAAPKTQAAASPFTGSSNTPAPSFGGGSSVFGTAATTPSQGAFGAQPTPQNSTPLFGQAAPQQNSFGSTTNAFGAATNAVPAFGSGGGSIPSFGSSTPTFGGANQSVTNNTDTKPAPTFQFGQNNNNTPSTGNFPFGAATNPPPNQTAPNQSTGFNFSASQTPTFNFGATAPASNQQPFQFNAPPKQTETNPFNATATPGGRKIKKAIRRTGRKT